VTAVVQGISLSDVPSPQGPHDGKEILTVLPTPPVVTGWSSRREPGKVPEQAHRERAAARDESSRRRPRTIPAQPVNPASLAPSL
jgi:hypothetical protein